jgi:hypothetical protein
LTTVTVTLAKVVLALVAALVAAVRDGEELEDGD